MKKSNAHAGAEVDELEFPDWSGMDDSPRRLDTETAWELCEEYGSVFTKAVQRRREVQYRCLVEFEL